MSNSQLVNYTKISPNKTSPRNQRVDTITIHCVVGQVTAERLGDIFAPKERQASSNYGVDKDGRIGMYVEEKDRSWCSSNAANDNRAITIEVASDTTHPYAVNDKAMKTLIKLCADICKRNSIPKLLWKADKSLIGQVGRQNMTVHRWFSAKACPGDYLFDKMGYIANEVNKLLNGGAEDSIKPPEPTPKPPTAQFKVNDIVEFTGNLHYTSSNALVGTLCKPGLAKVTAIQLSGKQPYHLIAEKGGGSNVYGWVAAVNIKPIGEAAPPAIDNTYQTYKVVSGDTLSKIASKFKTTVKIIADLNGITNVNLIRVGQVLKIPN